MSPQARDPAGQYLEGIFREIANAWELDDILEALPGRVNPERTENIMKWGVDPIRALRTLTLLTKGQHNKVARALDSRIEQRGTPIRPNGSQCTILSDVHHLITIHQPRPASIGPQINRLATQPVASSHRRRQSARIAERPQPGYGEIDDDENSDSDTPVQTPGNANAIVDHRKRKRTTEAEEVAVDDENQQVPKRVRGRARTEPVASRLTPIGPKPAEGHRAKIKNSQPELAVEHRDGNGNNAVQVMVDDVADDMDHLAFENKTPFLQAQLESDCYNI
jgi:hypothetical protein